MREVPRDNRCWWRCWSQWLRVAAVVVALWLGLANVPSMPYWDRAGLDVQNLYAFHNCPGQKMADGESNTFVWSELVYQTPGEICGDWGKRPMLYPPPLFHSFSWAQGLSVKAVISAWMATLAACMCLAFIVWALAIQINQSRFAVSAKKTFDLSTFGSGFPLVWMLFWGILLIQAPFVFELERANSNAPLVLLVGLGAVSFAKERYAVSGIILGSAAFLKLYPAFVVVVALSGVAGIAFRTRSWRALLQFVGGGACAAALLVLPFFSQWWVYLIEVLPAFSGESSGLRHFSHSLTGFTEYAVWLPAVLRTALLATWLPVAFMLSSRAPSFIIAGGLAVSTYFAGTSYDYNLVTVYPILLLLLPWSCSATTKGAEGTASPMLMFRDALRTLWLCLGIFCFLWSRSTLPDAAGMRSVELHILSQVIWLTLTPIFYVWSLRGEGPAESRS